MSLSITPTQWEKIPDISKVQPFNDNDEKCFKEIRDVLAKYNALNRFGLTLVHSHFDVQEDEILLETTNIRNRTQKIEVVKKDSIKEDDITITNWMLTNGQAVHKRVCVCARTSDSHLGYHRTQ